jgi:phage shock protein PspC (stress-responsive transcriptional regulator)
LSDNDVHDNETFLFSLISEYIDLTEEEVQGVISKVTEELKARLGHTSKEIETKPKVEKKPKAKKKLKIKETNSSPNKHSSSTSHEGIYRSSDDKVVIGLCAGLANKFNVKKELVRGILLIGTIMSSGTLLIPYFCCVMLKEETTK